MEENSLYDKKSLREITGKSADWNEVAKDCVAFSNAQGGVIDRKSTRLNSSHANESRMPSSA